MQNRKRSGKFYSKNEKQTAEKLGLKATKGSGSGWIEKEDMYNEQILAQLKSTDANSFRVSMDDMRKLELHAAIEHKSPLFVVQFISSGDIYYVIRKEELTNVCLSLNGVKNVSDMEYGPQNTIVKELSSPTIGTEPLNTNNKIVKTNAQARQAFHDERSKKWKKH